MKTSPHTLIQTRTHINFQTPTLQNPTSRKTHINSLQKTKKLYRTQPHNRSNTDPCTWEVLQSSKWVGDTTSNVRLMTLRYTIFCADGDSPCSRGMTWGHPYAIYIFCLFSSQIRLIVAICDGSRISTAIWGTAKPRSRAFHENANVSALIHDSDLRLGTTTKFNYKAIPNNTLKINLEYVCITENCIHSNTGKKGLNMFLVP